MRKVGRVFICVAMGALLTGTAFSKADGVVLGSRPPTTEERQPHDDREQKPDEPGSAYVLRRILLAQLQPAARVELFRLADRATRERLLEASSQPSTNAAATRPDLDTFGPSTILASGNDRGAASAAVLVKLLSNPASYCDEDPFHLSVDSPLVGARLHGTKGDIDIAFDFDQDILEVVGEGPGSIYAGQGGTCFSTVRPQLAKLFKSAFPDDARIQALRDKAHHTEDLLGLKVVAVMHNPDQVECMRVLDPISRGVARRRAATQHNKAEPTTTGAEEIGGGNFVLERTNFSVATAGRAFADALLDDDSYPRALYIVMCYQPGFAVRFSKGAEAVTFLICLHCSNFETFWNDGGNHDSEKQIWSHQISPAGWTRITSLAKQAFPRDPAIQALGADRAQTKPATLRE